MPRPSIASMTERLSHFWWLPRPLRFSNIIWPPSGVRFCPPADIVCLSNTGSTTWTVLLHCFLTTLSFRMLLVHFSLHAPHTLRAPQTLQPLKALKALQSLPGRLPVSSLVLQSVLHSSYSVSFGPFGSSKPQSPLGSPYRTQLTEMSGICGEQRKSIRLP